MVGQSQVPVYLSTAYMDFGFCLPGASLAGEWEEPELDPKQVFNFVGYQFDLNEGKVSPTPQHWQPYCPV